jgi:hypothetical protein
MEWGKARIRVLISPEMDDLQRNKRATRDVWSSSGWINIPKPLQAGLETTWKGITHVSTEERYSASLAIQTIAL